MRTSLGPVWVACVRDLVVATLLHEGGNISFEAMLDDMILTQIILEFQNTDITS